MPSALVRRVGGEVGEDRGVGDLLDQPGAEDRRGNPEDDVAVADLPLEVLLPDVAARRIRVAGDHEEVVTPPSRLPSGLYWRRASRIGPFWRDERRHDVAREPELVRSRGTGGSPPGSCHRWPGWLWQPAHPTKLKRGPTPSATSSSSGEVLQPDLEHLLLVGGQAGEGPAGSRRPPRTPGSLTRSCAWMIPERLKNATIRTTIGVATAVCSQVVSAFCPGCTREPATPPDTSCGRQEHAVDIKSGKPDARRASAEALGKHAQTPTVTPVVFSGSGKNGPKRLASEKTAFEGGGPRACAIIVRR